MKLRNKKTGEIIDLSKRGLLKSDNDNNIIVYPEGTLKYYAYDSLAALNEVWEDYKPAEPLIKDEKVRKAVRAWANVENIEKVFYKVPDTFESLDGISSITFGYYEIMHGCYDFDEGKYTIDELCGEEKE